MNTTFDAVLVIRNIPDIDISSARVLIAKLVENAFSHSNVTVTPAMFDDSKCVVYIDLKGMLRGKV